jgi:tetratricopeptide (TPR) repeat protein
MAQVLRARGEVSDALRILDEVDATGRAARGGRDSAPSLLFPRRQVVAHHAGVLLESGDIKAAGECIEGAFAIPAEDVRSTVVAYRVLAAVRFAQGRRTEAADAIEQALDLARDASYGTELALTERTRDRLFAR